MNNCKVKLEKTCLVSALAQCDAVKTYWVNRRGERLKFEVRRGMATLERQRNTSTTKAYRYRRIFKTFSIVANLRIQ